MTDILVTIGPSSFKKSIIQNIPKDVNLLRINLSHTPLNKVLSTIKSIKSWTNIPICIDTEGAQIRNGKMKKKRIFFKKNKIIKVYKKNIVVSEKEISLYPQYVFEQIKKGDIIFIDLQSLKLKIIKKNKNYFYGKVIDEGWVGGNKGANLERKIKLNALTDKDKAAIKIAKKVGIRNFALSFTNSPKDIDLIRKLIGKKNNLICKIESEEGLKNINKILKKTKIILIDRGDLSREIDVENIPVIQKKLIDLAKKQNVKTYVATNFLESMVESGKFNIAEANDVISTLFMGADGLVLAAETAIGIQPLKTIIKLKDLINRFQYWKKTKKAKTRKNFKF